MQKSFNEMKIILDDYKKITENLVQENNQLKNDNAELTSRLNKIEQHLDNNEQIKLKNNIIIDGVVEEEENIESIIANIGKMIDVDTYLHKRHSKCRKKKKQKMKTVVYHEA